MYFLGLISLCFVIATTAAATGDVAEKGKGAGAGGLNLRSVNVNLETVVEFDPKDNSKDVAVIDNIQKFLGKVKTVIDNKTGRRSYRRSKDSKTEKFTDFIKNVIEVLKTYSDDDLQVVVAVADKEIQKYNYQGGKFNAWVQNIDLRRFVASALSAVQNKQGKDIRKSLNNFIEGLEEAKYNYTQVELLDYIDSLYGHADIEKMESFLGEIQAYAVKSKRTNLSLPIIVQNGIRNIIVDHDSNLNPNERKQLNANAFNFLKDYAFDFVTPGIFTKIITPLNKIPKTTRKPKNSHQTKKRFVYLTTATRNSENLSPTTKPFVELTKANINLENVSPTTKTFVDLTRNHKHSLPTTKLFIDLTNLKIYNDPEEFPNYTDNDELKDKNNKNRKKGITNKSKIKRQNNNNKRHKRKKTDYRTRDTAIDEDLAPESDNSENYENDHVFRKHENIEPTHIFDFNTTIKVNGQTEEYYSIELWKPKSIERHKGTSKEKPKNFRRNITLKSEEGLSIIFEPMPIHLGLKN